MAMTIERPNVVKVFASDASHGNYLPVKFGTNIPVPKDNYAQVANDNFEYGLESLENDLQMKDLNSVFFYHGNLLGYLFQQGVPEFSAYQNYPMGAVVTYKGNLWIATKDIKASVKEPAKPAYDPCNPCSIIEACAASQVCVEPEYPSKETGWCAFVTKCEYDTKIAELETADEALQASIDNLKGVENFSILPNKNSGALELTLKLSDGSTVTIPMTKFGHITQDSNTGKISITNTDGSTLILPKYVAEKDLDQQKGFIFNAKSGKWEVDLADLETKLESEGAKIYTKGKGLTGTGKKGNELALNVTEDFYFNSLNQLALRSPIAESHIAEVTNKNLNTLANIPELRRLGMTTFYGQIDKYGSGSNFTVGFPVGLHDNAVGDNVLIDDALTHSQYIDQRADFTGYQFASPNEVVQVIIDDYHSDSTERTAISYWVRAYNLGMNQDGTLNTTGDSFDSKPHWTKWQRSSQLPLQSKVVSGLLEQVKTLQDALTINNTKDAQRDSRLDALEAKNNETCKIPCKNISTNYVVQETDNTLISTATSPITVTFPKNIPVGRMFTIIQAGIGKVTLVNQGNAKFIAPRKGSLVLGGVDAAVTVLYELSGCVRIFGDTETA